MFNDLRVIDIFAAARRIEGVCVRTPLRRSEALSALAGHDVHLKLECEQVTGSFKLRGAFNAIAALPVDVRARGVVASSAGNHGLGVAWSAHHLHVPAVVFVPAAAPQVKRRGIEKLGATVDAESPDYDEAMVRAKKFAADHDVTFINPCLGDTLIAGQGTVALEIVQDLPGVAMVVTPVGGAGLLAGTGSFLRRVAPHVRIAGAQSVNTAAMSLSLTAGKVTHIDSLPTLADGLAGDIDEFAFDIGKKALDENGDGERVADRARDRVPGHGRRAHGRGGRRGRRGGDPRGGAQGSRAGGGHRVRKEHRSGTASEGGAGK